MRRMRRAILGPRRWRPASAAAAHPALQRLRGAHAMFDAGEYASAAAEFRDLAERGEAAGIPRSTQVYVLAGLSYMFAGSPKEGMRDLERGIEVATRFGQLPRLAGAAPRITSELRGHGFEKEADAFVASLEAALKRPLAAPVPEGQTPRLPAKCPYCGGTIHPGEAEWVDERSIACDYCGSVVRAAEA
jgi:hypothetical protein